MGYSLSIMANFQINVISWIYCVFSSFFLHKTTLNALLNWFWYVFEILIFDLN